MEEEKDGEVLVEEEELAEEEELEEEKEEEELVEVVFEAGRAHLRPVAPGRPGGQHCSLLFTICYCQPECFFDILLFKKKSYFDTCYCIKNIL